MRKEDALATLNQIESWLKKLKTDIQKIKTSDIYRTEIKSTAQKICNKWFEEIEPSLARFGFQEEVISKYHQFFTTLLQLSIRTSWKKTYLKVLDDIVLDFKSDLYILIMKSAGQIVSITHLTKMLDSVTEEEKDYLDEALGCANNGFFRASVVLAWSAAVHRMHKTVERLGFDEFNKRSEEMKNIKDGRFKRFNKSFTVHSLSDLSATVFDNDLLWVLEYWGLIDANQHERLSICFTMRNNSAHPGEAPITEENVASFYSDLKSMVFDNPKFKL